MASYARSKSPVNIGQLDGELKAAGLPVDYLTTTTETSPDFVVYTSVALDAGQITLLDSTISAHSPAVVNPLGRNSLNYLLNANFALDLRGATASNRADAAYALDRWY